MLVVTPKPIDEALLHKIVYEFSLLYQVQNYLFLIYFVISYIFFVLLVEIVPVYATHTLNAICKVVGCCHIQIPLKALTDQKPFHFHELVKTEAISYESLGVLDAGLVCVLLVELGCQEDAAESY